MNSFPLATKEFTALLKKHPRDWVVSFLLQWLVGRMEFAVEASHLRRGSGPGGRGFAIQTTFHSNQATHDQCVSVLDQARRVLAVTSKLYNASAVCFCIFLYAHCLYKAISKFTTCCFSNRHLPQTITLRLSRLHQNGVHKG